MTSTPLIPVSNPLAQLSALRSEIRAAMERVLAGGNYILGPEVEAFENEFAAYIGVSNAVGVANGTDAIALALRSIGLAQGDEVITVSHTAVATVAAIEMAGCTPVLIDVEPRHLTLDPTKLDDAFTPRTRAVVAVHLYGQPVDLDRVQEFCSRTGVALVEDVSQAHGARWRGQRVGSFGHVAAYSCYPTKNLGALGDAGIITTNDPTVAQNLRRLRQYGWATRNHSMEAGVNSRLDELQAAVLRVKLRHLDAHNAARRAIARRYTERLAETAVRPLDIRSLAEHVFHLYVVEHSNRDDLARCLERKGIATAIHYPLAVHQQPAYQGRIAISGGMNHTANATSKILSLPMYPELTPAQIDFTIDTIKSCA